MKALSVLSAPSTLSRVLCFALSLGVAWPGVTTAQAPAAAPPVRLQEVLPFDAAVKTGKLPNGLTYFIRHNDRPAKRVALRLAVKAGSLNEADDQQGLAHLIEHMAFNGTTHFKPGELVSYFESTGARLGPHVNAYTSFDQTVYMFELPTDRSEVVSQGLTALADFAGGLSLGTAEVDKERGVVIEEWRGRLGAASRVRDKQIPVLYNRSRYAERITIGKPEIIRNAPVARLRSFYDTWYRPDRMALIVVGDINAADVEASVRTMFGGLKARAPRAALPDSTVPLRKETLVNVVADPEITQSTVQLLTKYPRAGQRTVADYRRNLVEGLFEGMFSDRLGELARKPDASFLSASVGEGELSPSVSMLSLSARVQDGQVPAGLRALAIEAKRVLEFGFTAAELERARSRLTAFYDRAYSERDKTESDSFASEYLNYFLREEPSPGIAYEYRLVQGVLPGISLADITAAARARLSADCKVILTVSPEKAGLSAPAEAELRGSFTAVDQVAVTPWSETGNTHALIEKTPDAGAVVSRRELPALGVSVVRFANGVEAWLKPTDFKNDQVVFTLYSKGGLSLAPPADFLNASLATSYLGLAGVGELSAVDLERLLAGKLVSSSPFVSTSTHGISGSSTPSQLETALQLLYQQFTTPRDDAASFALLKRQLEAAVANRGRSPGQAFGERLEQVNTSNHYTSAPLTPERVATLDRAKMLSFYKERFANAADFTFFMVGSFTEESAVPLLAKYVGALPSTGRAEASFKDLGIQFPKAPERAEVKKGREPRSQTVISFFADPDPGAVEQEVIGAATTVLETTLRDMLREELGQTYSVSVGLSQSPPQRNLGHVEVHFGAAPDNIQRMTDRVMQEVARLREQGPTPELTAKARESALRGYETALRQNPYWLRRLQSIHLLGGDPGEILTRPARIGALTPVTIQDAFKKYFPPDRYTVVTLLPE
jgi:zinc protease